MASRQKTGPHRRGTPFRVALIVGLLLTSPLYAQLADDQMITQRFKIDPSSIRKVAPQFFEDEITRLNRNLQDLFNAAGVKLAIYPFLTPNRPDENAFFLNDQTGALLVRASRSDMAKIEAIVNTLIAPPSQVSIEVKFIETPAAEPPIPFILQPRGHTNISILTQKQYRAALQRYEQSLSVGIFTPPNVTTISGRQARLQAEAPFKPSYQTPPPLPKDTRPDADLAPSNKGRLPFPPTFIPTATRIDLILKN